MNFTFEAIGTQWEIDTPQPISDEIQQRILERIDQFDAAYSRFRTDSLVYQVAIAANGGCFDFPDDAAGLFSLYDRLHLATSGAIDPLVGRDLELYGYDRTYSLTPAPGHIRAEEYANGRGGWSNDIIRRGTRICTERPLVLDFGAAGKGYLVDIIYKILKEAGLTEFVVDGSGDLRHSGTTGIRVGLEHPFDSRQVIGVVSLKNRAVCASAVNRRTWGDGMHHVLDARTGVPVQNVVATWVLAAETALADGLATALFFVSGDKLAKEFRFSYVRMLADGRAEVSPDFDGELFT